MQQALGLSTYRWNNNLKSMLLLALFPFLLLGLMGVIFFAFGMVYANPQNGMVSDALFHSFGFNPALCTRPGVMGNALANYPLTACHPLDLAWASIYTYWPIVLGIATTWVLIGYFFNDSIIHMATGAKAVERKDEPKLYNLIENLCISRGLKVPMLYVIETDAMNAYASGIDEKSYAITVTRGLLNTLNDHEVEAVLGHELTHIINRDCRLLIVTVVFVGMLSFASQLLWRGINFSSMSRNRDERGGGGALVMILIASVALFVGYILALALRFAISRRREFLADAGSVELTKNPEALISALRKISGNADVPHVPSEVHQMFIENPPSIFDGGGIFATHPPLQKRIEVLQQLGGLPPQGHSVIPNSGP